MHSRFVSRILPRALIREARLESIESTYGSDKHGLVWAYRFERDIAPVSIASEESERWLDPSLQNATGSFLWLHFSLANAASERWLRQQLNIPAVFFEALREPAGSTRLEQEAQSLVAVVHDAMFDFNFDAESISTVYLYLDARLFVTVRLRPVRSLDRLRGAVRAGQTFRSPADLLAQLLRHQAGVLAEIVHVSARRVDVVEDGLLARRIPTSRRDLGALRRTLVRLQRLLAPEPAALFRLLSRSPSWIRADDLQELRQATEEFSVTIADSANLVERLKMLQEELAALVGEQTNRTLFLLTVVTVLALPVNLIAGLLGMNVGGIPFTGAYGFFWVVAGLCVFTVGAALVSRRLMGDG